MYFRAGYVADTLQKSLDTHASDMTKYSCSATCIQAMVLLLVLSGASMARQGQDPVGALKPAVDEQVLKGIHLLYNRQFDEAEALFQAVKARFPGKPAPCFYLAMVSWSRLTAGFWCPAMVGQYKERIDQTVAVARARITEGKGDSFTYFYLGGALGFDGRFELMKGNWITSFFLASDAIEALKTCQEMDPDNKDVLLGLGTFDYYTARLSGVLKFLTYFLLHKGDKEEGLRKLTIAAHEAVYSATEAKSMLLHIYLFLENDLVKALSISEDLSETYPLNSRFRVLQGVSCIRLGKDAQYREIVSGLKEQGRHSKAKEAAAAWRKRALYLESIADLFGRDYANARIKLWEILASQDPEHDPAMIAWPRIKLGMSYDLEGDRDRAMEFYEQVLDMTNAAGAQFLAQKLSKKPPRKEDPFLGY
ncbi:MAG: tetratricopeptide repeat protein [Deltaproteobacteria bacterium]|nr:tetratricopeptide repeat protein [Deltaproteobacteria bacterium]